MKDLVIGVDASTTAVKSIAFTRGGQELAQARQAYPLSRPQPGHFEQEAEAWWRALAQTLKTLTGKVGAGRIAAISIAHQRETFTLVDSAGKALIPAILWLDERARPQVKQLSAELGRDNIRHWSGKPPDPTPALYALAWLAEHQPETLRKASAVIDVGGFLIHRLTGRLVTSTASADPLGLLDCAQSDWHPALVSAAQLQVAQLPELAAPGSICGEVSAMAAELTGLPAGLPVVAGAGDGQAMGLGMGVFAAGKAYLSLGSGVVGGTYLDAYRDSDAYRTLVAPSGKGFMLETVLRSGMQLVDWAVRVTGSGSAAGLEEAARNVPPGSNGLLCMPYWSGVMSPYWDEAARGALVGLSLDHGPAHMFRAVLEGIAFEQAIATQAMEGALGRTLDSMAAAGGGTNSILLMQILASVLDRPLDVSPVNEAAALGAAMLAASGLGWFPSPAAASSAMLTPPSRTVEPIAVLGAAYKSRLEVYRDLYQATRDIHARLHALDQV